MRSLAIRTIGWGGNRGCCGVVRPHVRARAVDVSAGEVTELFRETLSTCRSINRVELLVSGILAVAFLGGVVLAGLQAVG